MRAQRLAASKEISRCGNCRKRGNSGVLNALRHQRKFHEAVTATSPGDSWSAQRLAASKEISLTRQSPVNFLLQCSTPCGIKGNFTVIRGVIVGSVARAQRLAASKEISLCIFISKEVWERCSTPCGIKGNFTRQQLLLRFKISAMCSTPCGIKGNFTAQDFLLMLAVRYKWHCGDRLRIDFSRSISRCGIVVDLVHPPIPSVFPGFSSISRSLEVR